MRSSDLTGGRVYFVEWDYDNNTATHYERTGQCNRCGECCKADITYQAIPHLKDCVPVNPQNWWLHTDGKGTWNEVLFYGTRRFLKITKMSLDEIRCSSLSRSNKCLMRLFGGWSSVLCKAWPLSPKWTELFPNCGFAFEEIEHWAIDDV